MPELKRWNNRIVRNLAWVIASPPLVSGKFKGVTWWGSAFLNEEYLRCIPALEALDCDPSPLESYIAALKSKALGHRFEALVAYWLQISPRFELLDHNIQIQGEGRTLGELDFIVRDLTTGSLIHLEVSVKFYMGIDELGDPMCWYGSNLNDSFGKKIDRLMQHQTQLTLLYPEKMGYEVDQRCCCVKGRLFYPEGLIELEQNNKSEEISSAYLAQSESGRRIAFVSETHLYGVWGTDVERFLLGQSELNHFPLQKQEWLSEFTSGDQSLWVEKVQAYKTSVQCYALIDSLGNEVIRYFQFPEGYFDSVKSSNQLESR